MLTDGVRLLDHHCHGVVPADLDRPAFAALLTEAPNREPGRDPFDSLLGLAVRRWCAPVLDLEPHAAPDDYLARRASLGWREATRRLLTASGVRDWLVDTGYTPESLTSADELAMLGGGQAGSVLRLESVAEAVGALAETAVSWVDDLERALRVQAADAVGFKTVVAYRAGLAISAVPPSPAEVHNAADGWLRAGGRVDARSAGASLGVDARSAGASLGRLDDPVLGSWLVHLGARLSAELGLPLQVHTGFGDPDVRLLRANPALLHDLIASHPDARFMLLHCWPYQRGAGYLAHVFGHVWVDVGLAVPYVGARAHHVLGELLELAPFGSVCFSSDGYGLAELHFLGALLWRRALARLVDEWIAEDVLTTADADRLIAAMAHGNAAGAYRLPGD